MLPGTILKNRNGSIFAIYLKDEVKSDRYGIPRIIIDQLFIYSKHVELQKEATSYAHFWNEATPTDYKMFVNILDEYGYKIKDKRIIKKPISNVTELKVALLKYLKNEELREAVARLL